MDVQVVHDQHDCFGHRVVLHKESANAPSPVDLRSPPVGHYGSPTCQRVEEGKQARGPVPAVVMVFPITGASAHLDRCPHLLEQLAGHLIHADHGPFPVVGPPIDRQDIFHLRDKAAILLWRNHPLTASMWLESVFFSVCRTVS